MTSVVFLYSQEGAPISAHMEWFLQSFSKKLVVCDVKTQSDLQILHHQTFDVLITNICSQKFFKEVYSQSHISLSILLVNKAMSEYSKAFTYQEEEYVSLIIPTYNDYFLFLMLRSILVKQNEASIFGMDSYLQPHTFIHTHLVTGFSSKSLLKEILKQHGEDLRLGLHVIGLLLSLLEEMLLNAIFDAPGYPKGNVTLKTTEQSHVNYGCDRRIFVLSVKDPFGTLKKETLFRYLRKGLTRDDASLIVDKKESGAGLGLLKMHCNSHALVVNSLPGVFTEVIAMIDLHSDLKDISKMSRGVAFVQGSSKLGSI